MKWRTGRKLGRTIYLQRGDEPSDADQLIGVMDTRELAAQAVDAVNGHLSQRSDSVLLQATWTPDALGGRQRWPDWLTDQIAHLMTRNHLKHAEVKVVQQSVGRRAATGQEAERT